MGGKAYSKAIRGSYVEDNVIKEAMCEAEKQGLMIYDLARDYGLGKAQKMFGNFLQDLDSNDIVISAKFTPFIHYKKNCVRKSLAKDIADFRREFVYIYWLHLPTDIEEHLKEIIELYNEGKLKHIGVSNFTLDEYRLSKRILEKAWIHLYGVQNHYCLISREWKKTACLTGARKTTFHFGRGQYLKKECSPIQESEQSFHFLNSL